MITNNSVLDVMVRSVAIAAFLGTPRDVEIIEPRPQRVGPAKPSRLALSLAWLVGILRGREPNRTAGKHPYRAGQALPRIPSDGLGAAA